jgi:hypothetical protein
MILWFLDRFGLPGSYYHTWLNLLHSQGINPKSVRTLSLHAILQRQLLTKHGSRKAPTWIPSEGSSIITTIESLVKSSKATAVVLASPESLACIGVHPDHATLHNLRGSVYWRDGIPYIAMLPMSAWTSLVSQREIGAANYGFESQDKFAEGRAGTIHLEAVRSGGRNLDSVDSIIDSDVLVGRDPSALAGNGVDLTGAAGSGRGGGESLHGDLRDKLGGIPSGPHYREPAADDDVSAGFRDDSVEGGDDDVDEPEVDLAEDDGLDGSDMRENHDSDASPKETGGIEASDEEIDRFFYEPVLSPVGRFVLTADVAKLKRLITDGTASKGPKAPLNLRYR